MISSSIIGLIAALLAVLGVFMITGSWIALPAGVVIGVIAAILDYRQVAG